MDARRHEMVETFASVVGEELRVLRHCREVETSQGHHGLLEGLREDFE